MDFSLTGESAKLKVACWACYRVYSVSVKAPIDTDSVSSSFALEQGERGTGTEPIGRLNKGMPNNIRHGRNHGLRIAKAGNARRDHPNERRSERKRYQLAARIDNVNRM
jgi:hypothetical protein